MIKRSLGAEDHRKFFGEKQCWLCGKVVEGRRRHYCSKDCADSMMKLIDSTSWNLVKEKALKRDDYKCVKCGTGRDSESINRKREELEGKAMELHKIITWKLRQGLEYFEIPENAERIKIESFISYLDLSFLQVDHIKPISQGGDPFGLNNLQTLCMECHTEKTKKDIEELVRLKENHKNHLEKMQLQERKDRWKSWEKL